MPTLIISDVPDHLFERIERQAATAGHSVAEELRLVLETAYALPSSTLDAGGRRAILDRIEARWEATAQSSADEVEAWIHTSGEH